MNSDALSAAFDRLAVRAPDQPLLLSGRQQATVGEIDALAGATASRLAGAALELGEPIALQAVNGSGALAALLALRRAGLPAVLLDPQVPASERDRIAHQIGCRFLLRGTSAWPAGEDDLELLPLSTDREPKPLAPEIAVVKLTSGSTGVARGIATAAESLLADESQLYSTMALRSDDRLLAAIPFTHSYGLSSLLVPALVRGLPLVLPAEDDPFAPLQAAAAAEATVFPTVPAYLGALTRLAEPPPLPASLRLVCSAGAPLPAETSARFRHHYGQPVHVFYGASEAGGICYDREGGAAERGTVGCPVDGVAIELSDEGRVSVRSPAVADAYIPPDAARLAAGHFVTEDLARWQGGELVLEGRLNELINVRGRKVNPREVESALARLTEVEEALVTAATGGETGEQLVRAIVACRPGSLTARRVIDHCRRHLADYKTPRSIVLVAALPRTARGKIDRAALAALTAAAADDDFGADPRD